MPKYSVVCDQRVSHRGVVEALTAEEAKRKFALEMALPGNHPVYESWWVTSYVEDETEHDIRKEAELLGRQSLLRHSHFMCRSDMEDLARIAGVDSLGDLDRDTRKVLFRGYEDGRAHGAFIRRVETNDATTTGTTPAGDGQKPPV